MLQGAKLQQGHIPLYVRGDDANARQFPSLHAVQRHMADTGRFKMTWEDNEDEYEDFYNFDAVPMEEAEAGETSGAESAENLRASVRLGIGRMQPCLGAQRSVCLSYILRCE